MMPTLAVISLGFIFAIFKAALGLGFVIFVHELGHFLVAKMCGVRCDKFYVGFDVPIKIGPFQLPRTLFKKKWGETEYGIGVIPLGGYVKMLGQDDNPANAAKEAERIRTTRDRENGDATGNPTPDIDPRSYPAKSVLQRLAIISAGVVMNLIFAVIFAMAAYRMGVTYIPTVVGSTSPSLSAWHNGLQTGDRIIQLGREGSPSQHLRFDKDLKVQVMMHGGNKDLDLLVQPYQEPGTEPEEPKWVTVRLSSPLEELQDRPLIGIAPPFSTELGVRPEVRELLGHLPAYQTEPPLEAGDRILAVNGTPVADYTQLCRQLAVSADEPLRLEIERAGDDSTSDSDSDSQKRLEIEVAKQPVWELGIIMEIGPIEAIQKGSIAEQAGFRVGDRIVAINGKPIDDPLRIPDQTRRLAGQEIEMLVRRAGESEPVKVQVTPTKPEMLHHNSGIESLVSVESLGLAYSIKNEVKHVVEGSSAEKAGIVAGDLLESAEFFETDEEDKKLASELYASRAAIELGEKKLNWARVHDELRLAYPSTQVKLSYAREGRLMSVDVEPRHAEDWFYTNRGLPLQMAEETHQVESVGTALGLGFRETVEAMRQVYVVLYRLVTGQFSPLHLGGPGTIATVAGIEASQGTARLLIFLTLLSANLAVVNFLPIPVLDGGHAMFLIYEGIFRKPMPERIAFGLTMVGFCFVLCLMLFVIGLDVWRFGFAG